LPLVACRRRDGSQFGELPKTFDDDSVTLDTSDVLFEASDDVYRLIQSVGAAAFDALEMTGVGRIDVRLDIDGRPWVFDTNEAPPPLADTAFAVSMNALGHDLRGMLKIWLGSCLYEYGVISGIEPEGQIGQQEHATQF
jgi:hypothetical protein